MCATWLFTAVFPLAGPHQSCTFPGSLPQRLDTEFRLLLTGTPLQNNVQELWSLLNFLEPAKFSSYEDFQAEYGALQSAEQVTSLQAAIKPHLLRRVKEEVEESIPKKEETIIDVELTVMQVCLLERSVALVRAARASCHACVHCVMSL